MFIIEPRHNPNKPCVLEGGGTQLQLTLEKDIISGVWVTNLWHVTIVTWSCHTVLTRSHLTGLGYTRPSPVTWRLSPRPPLPSYQVTMGDHHHLSAVMNIYPFFPEDKPPLAPSCCSRQSRPPSQSHPCHDSCGQSTCRRGSRGHATSACHTISRDSGTMRRRRTLSRHNSLERARCNIVHSR